MRIGKQSRTQVAKIREQVFERDNHQCVVSGSMSSLEWPCAGGLTIQHAVGRGMGGSAAVDGIDYLRAMCAYHNQLDTSSADFHRACLRNGWSVTRWMAQRKGILVIPVKYPDGWHLLQHGERIRISEKTAETIQEELGL